MAGREAAVDRTGSADGCDPEMELAVRRAGAGALAEALSPLKHFFQRQQTLRMHQLQQTKLEMESLLLLVAEIAVGAQHDLQKARQVLFAESLGHSGHAGAFVRAEICSTWESLPATLATSTLRRKRTIAGQSAARFALPPAACR